jgi:hypothetical protein
LPAAAPIHRQLETYRNEQAPSPTLWLDETAAEPDGDRLRRLVDAVVAKVAGEVESQSELSWPQSGDRSECAQADRVRPGPRQRFLDWECSTWNTPSSLNDRASTGCSASATPPCGRALTRARCQGSRTLNPLVSQSGESRNQAGLAIRFAAAIEPAYGPSFDGVSRSLLASEVAAEIAPGWPGTELSTIVVVRRTIDRARRSTTAGPCRADIQNRVGARTAKTTSLGVNKNCLRLP